MKMAIWHITNKKKKRNKNTLGVKSRTVYHTTTSCSFLLLDLLALDFKDLNYVQRKQQDPNYNQSDSLHKLNRTEEVILFRLRTGHNRLNAHMYNKFKVGESEMCPCNADIMTAEYLLQHRPLHDAMRRDTWPEPTLLRDKLHGNLGELRRTAAFVRATGISI